MPVQEAKASSNERRMHGGEQNEAEVGEGRGRRRGWRGKVHVRGEGRGIKEESEGAVDAL
eukprot:6191575-Pleurochrysis_carterae.AAC.2